MNTSYAQKPYVYNLTNTQSKRLNIVIKINLRGIYEQ